MFTKLHIQNFKSWADTGEFRMAPLTGFFGTNSSGKTAILQFLLMLKQTVESSDRNRILHLGGDQYSYVDLGTNYDISHRHQLPKKLTFSLTWKPKLISQEYLEIFSVEQQLNNLGVISSFGYFYQETITFESAIDIDIDQVDIDFFKYYFLSSNNQLNQIGISKTTNNEKESSYRLITKGDIIQGWSEKFNLATTSIPNPLKSYGFQSVKNSMRDQVIYKYPLNITESYEDLFQNTYYLAPLRDYPKRTYQWSGESPQNVGNKGELTVNALLSAKKKDSEVELAVVKALKELRLIESFRVNRITSNRGDYEILVKRSPNSAEVLITDVGFGVSQVLPILVLCYYVPKGSTIIFEQPEIHLHPSVQAGLADIFIEVIKTRNIQIIIESHSEHLLTRLQRRMAEEKDGFTNDDAALYFCKINDQGDSELVTLDIDDYGNICNYPDGFFGDSMGDAIAMTEAAIKRQMNDGD